MFLRAIRQFDATRLFVSTFAAAALWLAAPSGAEAQVPGIMSPGDAVVTGFSGTAIPQPPFPSGNPLDETFIDLNGPSMQIQRLQPAGPPAAQLIASPTVFMARAWDVGQVFAVTLDDWPNPNVFLAATSYYGLNIVAPDSDGDGRPERITQGQPGAMWMDGQWGPGGAPGSIWRVDGTTGQIALFTTIGANTGPGLGDIVYDRGSRQLFVSDLDTGLIYRLDWTGLIVDTFDHGVTARPNMGLPPVPDDNIFMNTQNPAFDTLDPATWGYTQPERRIRGMAAYGGRLYYAVGAGPQIWSVGIRLDGSFAPDARWELDVVGYASQNEVTDIVFDGNGRMILAQRGAQTASYDYTVFAEPMLSSVLRYRREIPDNPATPGIWVPMPEEYAIGFRPDGHNTTGGIALGYGHNQYGHLRIGSCNQYLWTTGESLRESPFFGAMLAAGGPETVHGLQGNRATLVRPDNDPPWQSYFADYDGQFVDPENQGHMGDVEIWQPCIGADGGYYYPQIPPYFPPPTYVPPADPVNLRLDKVATPDVCVEGGLGYICHFTVRVTNTGPAWYWGPIAVNDWLPQDPAGTAVIFSPSPPWACIGTGPSAYSCAYPPVFLWPGEAVDLGVEVQLPADTDLCHLTNVAGISWPAGVGDANPADDWDVASAKVPNPDCDPPHEDEEETNLSLTKQQFPGQVICEDGFWCAVYLVTITNTGPGIYADDIVVSDTLNGAVIANYAPQPDWNCVGGMPTYTCTFAAAALPDGGGELHPGNSVQLHILAVSPIATLEEADLCSVRNEATITHAPGGTQWNTNPADDSDSVAIDLDQLDHCRPPEPPRSDLSILKQPGGCVLIEPQNDEPPPLTHVPPQQEQGTGAWVCGFTISITNEGPDPFNDIIGLQDTTAPPSPVWVWPGPPVCMPDGGGNVTCQSPGPIAIAPGDTFGPIPVYVAAPDDGSVCQIGNTVQIAQPPGGSPNNFDPTNDISNAVVNVPSEHCQTTAVAAPPPPDVCPIERMTPDGGCCPEGERWTGKACSGGEQPPPPPPPPTTTDTPPATCPLGMTGTPPNCTCPTGTQWDGQKCAPPQQTCPQGWTGTPPNCQPPRCPTGTTGTPPNCAPITTPTCPAGMVGTPPNCRPQTCPQGTTGTPPNCQPVVEQCPAGTVGTPPNCRPQQCPQGTTGTPPNCQPIMQQCPAGTIGTPPLCISIQTQPQQPQCPADSVVAGSGCRCKPGTSGSPGKCVPDQPPPTGPAGPNIQGGGITVQPIQPLQPLQPIQPQLQIPLQIMQCPQGTTGTFPNCVPLPK